MKSDSRRIFVIIHEEYAQNSQSFILKTAAFNFCGLFFHQRLWCLIDDEIKLHVTFYLEQWLAWWICSTTKILKRFKKWELFLWFYYSNMNFKAFCLVFVCFVLLFTFSDGACKKELANYHIDRGKFTNCFNSILLKVFSMYSYRFCIFFILNICQKCLLISFYITNATEIRILSQCLCINKKKANISYDNGNKIQWF